MNDLSPSAPEPSSQAGELESTLRLEDLAAGGRAPLEPSAGPLAPGDLLARRFVVIRLLGRGAMGEVYEAHDRELGERVALKTMAFDRRRSGTMAAETDEEASAAAVDRAPALSDEGLERFRREIYLARRVTHPNVCRIYDLFRHRPEIDGGPTQPLVLLSMEFLAGETLAALRRRRGRLAPAEALPIVRQIAAGLDAAHEAGIVHRDLKSGNVLLRPGGDGLRAVISDFGLARGARARELGATLTGADRIVGSPSYMSPEQVAGGEVGPRADVYAFGVVLFELVTGRLPFTGATAFQTAMMHLDEPPPDPTALVPDLDPRWEAVILRCLAKNPAERFATAGEAVAALEAPAPFAPPARRDRRHLVRSASLGTLAGAVTLLALVLARPVPEPGSDAVQSSARDGEPTAESIPAAASASPTAEADPFATAELATAEATASYRAGLERLRRFDPAAARESLARAVELDPASPLAHSALAVAWQEEGFDARAAEAAGRALEQATELAWEERKLLEGRYRAAMRDWPRAIAIFRTLWTVFSDRLDYGLLLADAQLEAGEAAAARSTVAELRRLLTEPAPDATAAARVDLAEARACDRLGDTDCQLAAARRAIARSAAIGSPVLGARGRLLEGRGLERAGDFDGALAAYREAVRSATGVDDGFREAQGLQAIAVVLTRQGSAGEARELFENALATYRERESLGKVAEALSDLAAAVADTGDLAAARELQRQAYEVSRTLTDLRGQARSLAELAELWRRDGLYREAAERYRRSLEIWRRSGERARVAETLIELGSTLQLDDRPDEAAALYETALEELTEIGDRPGVGRALVRLAEIRGAEGGIAASERLYREALKIFRQVEARRETAIPLTALAGIARRAGRLDEARSYADEALALAQTDAAVALPARLERLRVALADDELTAARARAGALTTDLLADLDDDGSPLITRLVEARLLEAATERRLDDGARAAAALARARELLNLVAENDRPALAVAVRLEAAEQAAARGETGAGAELARIARQAARDGRAEVALSARLSLARLGLDGEPETRARARARLEALAIDARAAAYGGIARQAEELLAGEGAPG